MSQTSVARAAGMPAGIDLRADRGHAVRMEAAFDRYSGVLYRYVLVRVGGDSHLADDLMQQLWCQACLHGGRIPPDEIEFWLRAVARNLILTHWRKQGRRPKHTSLPDEDAADLSRRIVREPLPAELLARREVREQLLRAITALPADDQELVIEHYFLGASHAELAARLGASVRAIEGRLYRARQALRGKLESPERDD